MTTEHEQFEKLLDENRAFVAKMKAHRECQEQLQSVVAPSHPVTLGDFELRGEIGRGGMGVVYEAWQSSMDRRVALKVLPGGLLADLKSVARFEREAKVAGKLHHPNVVAVHGMGVDNNTPHYAMEYVEGETLAQINTRLDFAREAVETPFGRVGELAFYSNLARAFADVADGLQHAHEMGVIHRDVKPSNLILDAGRLRILDFGLARFEGQESLTLSGDVVGTPPYMSPEQARREKTPVDHRTDVYSLGATLYEALTGRPPFRGKNPVETLSHVIERDPVPPTAINRRIPKDLETIALQCLRKDAGDRYGTAEALAQDLRRFVRGDPIEARRLTAWEKMGTRLRRHRKLAAALVAAVVLALVGLSVSTALIATAKEEAETERDAARENLYAAHMGLALQSWELGNIVRLETLLEAHRPEPGETDLRGWEWFHLDGLRDQALATLEGHDGWVRELAWHPSGELVASGGNDGLLKIWSVASGREVRRIKASESAVGGLDWSPDGSRLASGGPEGVVTVWDATSGRELARFEHLVKKRGIGNGLRAIAWSPDGSLLAAGGNDEITPTVWDVESGAAEQTFESIQVNSIAWSPDGRELCLATFEGGAGTVDVWAWRAKEKLASWKIDAKSAAWSPDGSRIALGTTEGNVIVRERATGHEEISLKGHSGEIRALEWNGDGRRLASGAEGGLVKVWDGVSGEELRTLRGHKSWVRSVRWSPDGELLASAGNDRNVKIWIPDEERGVRRLDGRFPVAWSPDGRYLATAGEEDGSVNVVEVDRFQNVLSLEGDGSEVLSVAWSPDSAQLAVGKRQGLVEVWDASTRQVTFTVRAHEQLTRSVAWSPDGSYLAAGGKGFEQSATGARTKIWDMESGEELLALGGGWSVGSVAWSPGGEYLAAAEEEGQGISVWDVSTGEELQRLERHEHFAWGVSGQYSVAWSPRGDRLLAGSSEGFLVIWDAYTGEPIIRLQGHTSQIPAVAWSPDGGRIVSGGNDGTVKIWKLLGSDLQELITLRAHEASVLSVAWSPDGSRLATGSRLSVVVWEAPGWTD